MVSKRESAKHVSLLGYRAFPCLLLLAQAWRRDRAALLISVRLPAQPPPPFASQDMAAAEAYYLRYLVVVVGGLCPVSTVSAEGLLV
jgi:hypothetical protein